jgi:hypothetical protein
MRATKGHGGTTKTRSKLDPKRSGKGTTSFVQYYDAALHCRESETLNLDPQPP